MIKKSIEYNCLHFSAEPSHSKLRGQEGKVKIRLIALLVKKIPQRKCFGYLFSLALPLLWFYGVMVRELPTPTPQ